jgi:hypothetical protein
MPFAGVSCKSIRYIKPHQEVRQDRYGGFVLLLNRVFFRVRDVEHAGYGHRDIQSETVLDYVVCIGSDARLFDVLIPYNVVRGSED